MNLVTLWRHKGRLRSNPRILTSGCRRTLRDDTSGPVSHDNSAGWRSDLGKGLKAMFQFGCAGVVKERPGEASALEVSRRHRGRVPAQEPYLGVLPHILIRFTSEHEPFCPQSSKGRSDLFFDRRTVIKAGAVRFKTEHWSSRTG